MPSRYLESYLRADFLNEARANAAGGVTTNLPAILRPLWLAPGLCQRDRSINIGSLGVGSPQHLDQWTYGYKDVATKVLRAQTMKFGFDFTQLYYLNAPLGTPNYSFYNLWTS